MKAAAAEGLAAAAAGAKRALAEATAAAREPAEQQLATALEQVRQRMRTWRPSMPQWRPSSHGIGCTSLSRHTLNVRLPQLARLEAAHADLEAEHAEVTGEQARRCGDLEAALAREQQRVHALERRCATHALEATPCFGKSWADACWLPRWRASSSASMCSSGSTLPLLSTTPSSVRWAVFHWRLRWRASSSVSTFLCGSACMLPSWCHHPPILLYSCVGS